MSLPYLDRPCQHSISPQSAAIGGKQCDVMRVIMVQYSQRTDFLVFPQVPWLK